MTTPSARAEAITRRTYNRPLDEAGTVLETWEQTAHRATVVHHSFLWESAGGTPDLAELNELNQLVYERKALVAGRTLWLGGTDYGRSRACANFNCSFVNAQTVYNYVDGFWLLLNGCGLGFKPRAGTLHGFLKPIQDVEIIESQRGPADKGRPENHEQLPCVANDYHWIIQIGDSAEAWAKSLGKLINPPRTAVRKLTLDFSEVRGHGKRLKGYGWICNGWQPLVRAYQAIIAILNAKAGELLDELDLLDVMNWLGTVLSSRRSAQLAAMDYGHPRWQGFAQAKRDWWLYNNNHRQQSNNSLIFWHKPSRAEIRQIMLLIWECGGSEPGFLNGDAARRRAPWFEGVNPCVTADTWIHTTNGARRVSELLHTPFTALVDGKPHESPTGFVQTGVKPVFKVTLINGMQFRATDNHKILVVTHQTQKTQRTEWRELRDMQPGDRVVLHNHRDAAWSGCGTEAEGELLGSLVGDGTLSDTTAYLDYWGEHRHVMAASALAAARASVPIRRDATGTAQKARVGKQRVQSVGVRRLAVAYGIEKTHRFGDRVEQASYAFYRGFLRKWFDADGTVGGNHTKGISVRLSSIHLDNLQRAQRMLARMGILTTIYPNRRDEGWQELPDGRGGYASYWCQAIHELVIANDNIQTFASEIGFSKPDKHKKLNELLLRYKRRPNRERFATAVLTIEADGTEPVYDCSVPGPAAFDGNGVYLHNCSEILLSSQGFCNLVTTAVSKFKNDFHALTRALYIMGRANYRQTCVDLNDGILSPEWHQTNEALRLCGMSLTGIAMAPWLTDYQIKQLRNAAIAGAYSMADELGLPRPKLVTTLKPEGTASKIMDVSEGVHTPLGKYIFNWVNFSHLDPIVGILGQAGYRVMDNPNDPTGRLVCFPVAFDGVQFSLDGQRYLNRETAVDQLNRYRRWNTLWTDHNTSVTVSWDISELDDIVDWLDRYWDDFVGVSWLRRADPALTAADLGYAYLPQEVVTDEAYKTYTAQLQPVDWSTLHGIHDMELAGCDTGMCPIK